MQAVQDGMMPTPDEEAERVRADRADGGAADGAAAAGGGGDEGAGGEGKDAGAAGAGAGVDAGGECERLSIDSTPEFMQLPLEYQGYCPWTAVERKGLLLPGNPALGVVRFRNTFNVFVHEEALQAFMARPAAYVDGILGEARRNPSNRGSS